MNNIGELLQQKAQLHLSHIEMLKEKGMEMMSSTVGFSTLPTEVLEDGRFFIKTGNKNKPQGLMDEENTPDLVFLYNKKFGLFLERDTVLQCMKDNKSNLETGIDSQYSVMGVWLNLGLISSYLDEDFLKLSSQFS